MNRLQINQIVCNLHHIMMPLTSAQLAQARQHTYRLLGRLFISPITADLLPYLKSIPDLVAVLPSSLGIDEAAAAHHQLFAFNLYPYAAIFLDPSRLLGGPVTNEIEAVYRRAGFEANSAVDPDHLAQAFGFLAFLSEKEASDLDSEQTAAAVQQEQLCFINNHLLPWLIPVLVVIQHQEDAFYREIARLGLETVTDHYGALKSAGLTLASIQLPTLTQQSTDQPALEDGRTGLRDIARYLITPIHSGLYLGRSDINRLARTVSLPHGFGSREQMLQTLLEASGQYETAPRLFQSLQDLVSRWRVAYEEVGQAYPKMVEFVRPWQSRLQQTQQLLIDMKSQVSKDQVSTLPNLTD